MKTDVLSVDKEVHNLVLFKKVMDYNLDLITNTFARRQPEFANQAKILEMECKRFLYLAMVVPHLEHAPTKPIDEYWHMFVLFTREYTAFCNTLAGRYIHHKPLGAADHQAVFNRTHDIVKSLFGQFKNKFLWELPAPATSCCSAIDNDFQPMC